MKNISIILYSIEELSKEAQENAIEKYRYFCVEDGTWYAPTFNDFTALCKTIGVTIPDNGIFFSGFWSQGDGSTFKSVIDEVTFIKGIHLKTLQTYAPHLELNLKECPCNKRVIRLIEKGFIECNWHTETPKMGYWIDLWTDYRFITCRETDFTNIGNELDKLDKWLKECLIKLNGLLYKSLEAQYEYETSEKTLKEVFVSNGYLFTADGQMAGRLLELATDQNG